MRLSSSTTRQRRGFSGGTHCEEGDKLEEGGGKVTNDCGRLGLVCVSVLEGSVVLGNGKGETIVEGVGVGMIFGVVESDVLPLGALGGDAEVSGELAGKLEAGGTDPAEAKSSPSALDGI